MKIFNGKKISENILDGLKKKITKEKISPTLGVIFIGKNPESKLYLKNKKKAADKIGVKIISYNFNENIEEETIIDRIKKLNHTPLINGIIVQLPLPKKFNTNKIIDSIDPKKDVDGFTKTNRRLLKINKQYFAPVLPSAILIALKYSSKNLKRKNIIIFVNSDIFGQTSENFFKNKKIKIKYFVTKKYSLSEIKSKIKSADIIISVYGKPGFIKAKMIKENVILIDAGIKITKGKLMGDFDRKSVEKKASFLTPVPGGIGPLTVALLLNNLYLAAKKNGFRN